MSIKALNWAFDLYFKIPSHKLVMLALADNATNEGLSYPFLKTIGKKACIKDERTVRRILRKLQEDGYISYEENFKRGGKQTSNCYQLHMEKEFPTIENLSTWGGYKPPYGGATAPGGEGLQPPHAPPKTPKKPKRNNVIQEPENPQPKLLTINNNLQHKDVVVIPDWLKKEDWEDFKKFRHEIGNPLTIIGEKRAIAKLEKLKKLGHDPVAVIEKSIDKGWTGLHPLVKQDIKPNGELKSTVKFWEKGNPDYDRYYGGSD